VTDPVVIVVDLQAPFSASRSFSIPATAALLSEEAADLWGSPRCRRVNKTSWKQVAKQYGIVSTDALYLSTQTLFAEHRALKRVPEWLVWIRRDTPVAQVWTFTVGGNTAGDYKLRVDGVVVATYTADGIVAAATIRTNLVGLFNAGTTPQTALAGGGATATVTADEAGVSFLLECESPGNVLTAAVTTPNVGIADDMDEATGPTGDDSFYIVTEASQSDGVIMNLAAWVQAAARRLLFFGQSNTAAITQNVSTDVFSKIKALGLGRTSGWYHPTDSEYLAAGVIGRCIAQPVGQINWAHRQIALVLAHAYALDAGVADILEDKYVNRYDAIELGSTLYGTMADGLFIDQAILRDVVESGLKSRMTQVLQGTDFVEYGAEGAEYVAAVILGYANELVAQGALFSGSVRVSTGKLEDVPSVDQKNRNWPLFVLSAKARGPMNQIIPLQVLIAL
jgi:hypothetical protein